MIYMWKCTVCEYHVEIERPIARCTEGPGIEDYDGLPICDCTEGPESEYKEPQWQRVFQAPAIMQASYPDGTKRKGWSEMREAAGIEKEALRKPQNKRAEYAAEIRKLGVKSNLISTGGKK